MTDPSNFRAKDRFQLLIEFRAAYRRCWLSPTGSEPTGITLNHQHALYVSSVWAMLPAGTGCEMLRGWSPCSVKRYVVQKMQRNITDEVCSCLNIVTLSFRSSSLFCVYRFPNEFRLNPEILLFDLLPIEYQSFCWGPVPHSFDRSCISNILATASSSSCSHS